MARPVSRSRRRRDEDDEEEDDRRGRRGAARKPSGPPPMVLLAGGAVVILGAVAGIVIANGNKAPAAAPPPAVVLAPPKKELPPPRIDPPVKVPPKPLTEAEKAVIDALFARAQGHIDVFRQHAKEGWEHKKKGDNEAANDAWSEGVKEFTKALGIVNEAIEDEDRFPAERPGMSYYIGKLSGWQKEREELPKVNMTR